ncbi:MAG TPA: hypothetical protein V6C81_24010 [Planktothrix sp.]
MKQIRAVVGAYRRPYGIVGALNDSETSRLHFRMVTDQAALSVVLP